MILEAIITIVCGMICSASVTWMVLSGNRKPGYLKRQWKQSERSLEQWQQRLDTLQTDEERKEAIDELLRGW